MDHSRWRRWYDEESRYQDRKWADVRPIHYQLLEDEGLDPAGRWCHDIEMYLHRANVLGLHNLNGRQALAKAAMVVIACVEASEQVFGPLPAPGYASGEIREWDATDNR